MFQSTEQIQRAAVQLGGPKVSNMGPKPLTDYVKTAFSIFKEGVL